MPTVEEWLASLGLSQYAERFFHAGIDASVLPQLTDHDLKEIGVLLGHRRRILAAAARLGTASSPSSSKARDERVEEAAERRQLTVMLCDLEGSTALSGRFDPEDLKRIVEAYQHCCTELVERNGGVVAKYMGDGLLAYFGYPHAQEHDAERAVRTGLALLDAVPKLVTAAHTALQVRIGIATGLVVIGSTIAEGPVRERVIVGETPNLAARLQALAAPGTVVISSNTRRLTGGLFEYRDLGTSALKGFAGKVQAWQVTGASAIGNRFEALRASTTPLVGRQEEMQLLLGRWEEAKRREGGVVLVTGEPGIGKSRLAQTLLDRVSSEPHTRLRFFCSPHHKDTALYPAIAQLEHAAGFRRDDTDEQRLAKLESLLAVTGVALSDAVPLVADLLSISIGDRYPRLEIGAQKRKEKLLDVLVAQVEGLAAREPVLLVAEDAHWADPTSIELFDLLVERASRLPLLAVVTFRPEFTPTWLGRPQVTLIGLSPLSRSLVSEMIAHLTAGKVLPPAVAEQIIARTDGVPLFVEEVTTAVLESAVIEDGTEPSPATGPSRPIAVPASLQDSLLARVDRLGLARDVAQVAAAIGRHFARELLVAVAAMPPEQVDSALTRLVRAGLIYRRGTSAETEYAFKHALVQDAVYGTLLRSRRRQLHAHIAATLEERFPAIASAQPALLASHCADAELADKAAMFFVKAGQQALARSAMREAVAQLRKALDMLADVPDGPWRRQQELKAQMALRPALAATKGFSAPEVGETIARARTLAEQIGQPRYLAPLLLGHWAFHTARSEHRRALQLAEQSEQIGEALNDPGTQMLARSAIGLTRCFLGDFVTARALLERCRALGDPAHRSISAETTVDPFTRNLTYLALAQAHLGYVEQSQSHLLEALSEAQRLNQPHLQAFVLVYANWIEWLTRSPELEGHSQQLLSLASERELSYFAGPAMAYRGAALTMSGQAEDGLTLLAQGIVALRATAPVVFTPQALMMKAETHARLGQTLDGLACLSEAARIIDKTEERAGEAELHRVRGDLLRAGGEFPAAAASYAEALRIANRQGAKLLELRAAIGFAQLKGAEGARGEVRSILGPVLGWFTEGSDTPVLAEAKALLSGG